MCRNSSPLGNGERGCAARPCAVAIDEFKLGEAQVEADMTETPAGGFGGKLFRLAQEGRQFELSQVMREQNLRRRRAGGRSRGRHAALPESRTA
jgi:hypothetical protein